MLLRSISAPVAQSFFSDSPNTEITKTQQPHHHFTIKDFNFNIYLGSFYFGSSISQKFPSGSSEFNPNSLSSRLKSFRRAQSDSSLEALAPYFYLEDFHHSVNIYTNPMLRTEASFSIYNFEDGFGEEKVGENMVKNDGLKLPLERCVTIGDNIGSGNFSFGKSGMGLIKEEDGEKEQNDDVHEDAGFVNGTENLKIEEIDRPVSPPMYLATGFGMDGNGIGGGGGLGVDFKTSCFDEVDDVEEFYKMLVSEDPSNPLFLRNYARLLQSKGDLSGAEDLYFRATLAGPKDGEILLQYAKLVWELHHDQDRALSYFERAACATPEDTHVLAAYASFLWEVDDGNHEEFALTDRIQFEDKIPVELSNSIYQAKPISPGIHLAAGLEMHVAGTTDYTTIPTAEGVDIEDYYKMMVEANSSNPLFLRNYAQFLYQSKGDLRGAEDYYSRAILADPGDGEIISQYANLVWELYRDHDKALCYFEHAIQAAPEDSHILAAYAMFLWETDDGDEDSGPQNVIQLPVIQVA